MPCLSIAQKLLPTHLAASDEADRMGRLRYAHAHSVLAYDNHMETIMLRLMLNIGMQTSTRYGIPTHSIAESRIRKCLEQRGLSLRVLSIRVSRNTQQAERAFCCVVQDDNPLGLYGLRDRIMSIAEELHQDCIACVPLLHGTNMCLYEAGRLIGPHHQAWGEFDPQFFLEAA